MARLFAHKKSTFKGQVNSIDMLLAITAFSLIIVFVVVSEYDGIYLAQKSIEKNNMERSLLGATDILLKTRGVPENWEQNVSSLQMIGLVGSQNILQTDKLSNFTTLNYSTAKNLLGLDYDFYFFVENLNGSELYTIGNVTATNNTVSITRYAGLNNQKVRVRMGLYG